MEEIIDKIIELLKEGMKKKQIKKFYFGDPIDIPVSLMPCIAVEPDNTNLEAGPTGMDDVGYNIIVKVIMDKRVDFGKGQGEVIGTRTLIDLTEGQNTDRAVAGILRKNFTLGNNVYNQIMTIEYGVTPRPKEVLTAEAHIRINVKSLVEVQNRT